MRFKNFTAALLLLFIVNVSFAQNFGSTKKGTAIGFSVNGVDFSASVPKAGKLDPGFSVMYWKGITDHVDFSVRYNGLFTDYTKSATVTNSYTNEFEGSLHARLLTDDHLLNPFLSAGLGIGSYGKNVWAGYAPLGVGIQLNMFNEGYLFLQANYRTSFSKTKLDNNMFYSLGFTQSINAGKAKEKVLPPAPIAVVTDRDNDGVPDSTDACPDVAGLVALKGCPDTDGDGIADKDDKCPTVAGLAKYQGCPIPDTDGDGINDELDKCPTVAGTAKYQGCPIPDTDGDGVNDEEDKCPKEVGPASNFGCPVIAAEIINKINVDAKNLFFATGSSKLLAKSNASLNNVISILNEHPSYKVDIAGHTDNTGKIEKNQLLSEARANAVKTYLVKKGVDETRLVSAGFGQEKPLADNKTSKGRAKNRRVEMNVRNF